MGRFALGLFCALSLAVPALAQERILHVGLREDPDILDPTLGSSYVGRIVFSGICDKLFDIDAKLNIVPQLATGYEWKDPTHLLIHLRDGVTFQDGEKLDADAAKYKLMRDLTIKGSMRRGEVNSIDSIDVIDPLTVQLNLKAPAAQLLAQLTDRAGIMISPKAAEAAGDKFGLHPVCAGPFSFESRVAQDRIVLKRFPGYWNAKDIHFDQVVYLPNPNSSVRLANLQAGALDIVEYILPTDVPAVQRDPKLKMAIDDSLAYTGITINTNNGAAQDSPAGKSALVRQAFELAIDRQALIQVVYSGMFTPTIQANPPSSPFYFEDMKPPARDVAKAKALLQQAGCEAAGAGDADHHQRLGHPAGRRGDPVDGERGRVRREDQDDGVRLVIAGGVCRRLPGLPDRMVGPLRSGWQHVADAAYRRHVQLRALFRRRRRQGTG